MNKKELIEAIVQKRELNIEAVGEDLSFACDEIFAAIVEAVAEGKAVEIDGFGSTFYVREEHLSRIRKPYTRIRPQFSPDFNFRDAVSKKKES